MLKNLVLIGFSSCGKTTRGQQLAQQAGWGFVDTDTLVSNHCRENYQKDPVTFRRIEQQVLHSLLYLRHHIVATGGGSILDEENVTIIKRIGLVVYLQVEKESLKRRLLQPPLPSFLEENDPEASFEKMYAERSPIYQAIADRVVSGYE